MSLSQSMVARLVLFAMMILVLLINVDYTAVNIAMLPIAKDVGSDLNTLQWLLSAYVLSWAAFVIPGGQMADIFGKRRILLWGVSLFTLASVLCGVVNSAEWLIFARVLQGMGGAMFVPPLYALVFECFPENRRGFAIGMLGVGAGIGLAIGPTFGGYILNELGWRWIFLINGPLCTLTIALVMIAVKKEPKRLSDSRLDIKGSIALGLTLMTFIYTMNQSEVWGLSDVRLWGLLALSLVFLGVFTQTKKYTDNPLIPAGIFKNRAYMGCMIGFGIYAFAFSAILVTIGLYLQNIKGYTPYDAGMIFLAMTIALGALSPYGGGLVDKMDARIPICGGLLLLAISVGAAMTFSMDTSLYMILGVLFLMGLGMGLAFPALNAKMMQVVDPKILSTASGTFIMCCCSLNSLGVVVSTSLFTGLGVVYLKDKLAMSAPDLASEQVSILNEFLGSAYRDMSVFVDFVQSDVPMLVNLVNESLESSLTYVMGMVSVLSIFAAWYCYRMIRTPSA